MVNGAFKKIKFLFILLFLISITQTSAQKKITSFSEDFKAYLQELENVMTASDNSDLKSNFKDFKKLSSNNSFTNKQENQIIDVSNKMLKKRLKASSHFNNFILCLSSLKNKNISNDNIDDWLMVVSKIIDDFSSKKLMVFYYFTLDLIDSNTLRETRTTTWKASNNDYSFKIDDTGPYIVFNSFTNILCQSDGDKLSIYNVLGDYYPYNYMLNGLEGLMNWEKKV